MDANVAKFLHTVVSVRQIGLIADLFVDFFSNAVTNDLKHGNIFRIRQKGRRVMSFNCRRYVKHDIKPGARFEIDLVDEQPESDRLAEHFLCRLFILVRRFFSAS